MPLKGLKPEVILQFHVAGLLLGDMGPRIRRPIRFLEPDQTRPMALDADSEFSGPGAREAEQAA